MVMRGSGAIEHVGRPGSVLGWVEDPKLLDVDFELAPRESLVLFTDGVTEARTTGDAYGLGGLGGTAARGGRRGRGGHRRARGSRRGARRGAPR